jgi:hypothetical protein
MRASFERAVAALAETIIRERCSGPEHGAAQQYQAVARFLLGTQAAMPDFLRLPLATLTLSFDLAALPAAGRRFHRLPHERRARHIRAWKSSRLGFRRDLIKFYETLAIFGWYSELYGSDYSHS